MDILGPLPRTPRDNKYILVIGDYFTKWTEAYAIPNMEAETVENIFVNEFVARHGPPEFLHTDQGKNFESNLMKEVCQLLGVSKTRTTPYHPQSDGMTERFNCTLLSLLSKAASDNEVDRDKKLPMVMLAYRTSVHESTKSTPFSLMYKKDTPPQKNLVVHYNRLKPYRLSTNCQPDPLDPWDYLVGDPTHTSDNEQDRPLTSRQVSEDQDRLEQPASLPNTNVDPTVELRRSTRIRRPVIRCGDVVTY